MIMKELAAFGITYVTEEVSCTTLGEETLDGGPDSGSENTKNGRLMS